MSDIMEKVNNLPYDIKQHILFYLTDINEIATAIKNIDYENEYKKIFWRRFLKANKDLINSTQLYRLNFWETATIELRGKDIAHNAFGYSPIEINKGKRAYWTYSEKCFEKEPFKVLCIHKKNNTKKDMISYLQINNIEVKNLKRMTKKQLIQVLMSF